MNQPTMTQYLITWQIEVEAANPVAAAEQAREIQRRYDSEANVFDVRMNDQDPSEAVRVDLDEIERRRKAMLKDRFTTPFMLNAQYNQDGDGEYPYFTRQDWRMAAFNQQTVLGYWEWVKHRIDEEPR